MSRLASVAWQEGMLMLPQHFQQQERSLQGEDLLLRRALHPYGYGVFQLDYDAAALARGRFELKRLQAVLPDGSVLNGPERDPLPGPLAIDLPPGMQGVDVYVGVPVLRTAAERIGRDGSRPGTQLVERTVRIQDDFKPEAEEELVVCVRNLRLVTGAEAARELHGLLLGRLERGDDGQLTFRLDAGGPLLNIHAAPHLLAELTSFVTLLHGRASGLARERSGRAQDVLELSGGDLVSFWMLTALNQVRFSLQQLLQQEVCHPFPLFLELLRLAGTLCALAPERAQEMPTYSHLQPSKSIGEAMHLVRTLLGSLVPAQKHVLLELTRDPDDAYWKTPLSMAQYGRGAQLMLEIVGVSPSEETISHLLKVLKVSDQLSLDTVVIKAIPGLPFTLSTRSPAGLATAGNSLFLNLKQEGTHWENIRQTQSLAAYIPSMLGQLKVRLIITRGEADR